MKYDLHIDNEKITILLNHKYLLTKLCFLKTNRQVIIHRYLLLYIDFKQQINFIVISHIFFAFKTTIYSYVIVGLNCEVLNLAWNLARE